MSNYSFDDPDFDDSEYDSLLSDKEPGQEPDILIASIDEPHLYDSYGDIVMVLDRSVRDYGSSDRFVADIERRTGQAYKYRKATKEEIKSIRDDYQYQRPNSFIVLVPTSMDDLSGIEETIFRSMLAVCESIKRRRRTNG